MTSKTTRSWSLSDYVCLNSSHRFPVIILNTDISSFPVLWFERIWNNATLRVCADGGANRVYDYFTKHLGAAEFARTDVICGDFDSAKSDVLRGFYSLDTEFVINREQDSTDLEKCFTYLLEKKLVFDSILIVSNVMSGRMDQMFSIYNAMSLLAKKSISVFALSPNTIFTVLPVGQNTVLVNLLAEKSTCGLIPICGKVHAETNGLKWNIGLRETLEFGKFISTSNEIVFQENNACTSVKITCDAPLLWCCELDVVNFGPDNWRKQ